MLTNSRKKWPLNSERKMPEVEALMLSANAGVRQSLKNDKATPDSGWRR